MNKQLMLSSVNITVGARDSLLSKAQVEEVEKELSLHYPHIKFSLTWVKTFGDKDLATSLRHLDKTDFFTREIDNLQKCGACRIAIHAAKDLPDPLPQGLMIVALTKGVDPSDVLVCRKGETFSSLPFNAKVGTSSIRRESAVKKLRSDFIPVDIRGTIEQRLSQLDEGKVDALVMAEAALIRLKIERERLFLEGGAAPLQGRLAVVAKDDDVEMKQLFACIDAR